MRTMHFHYKNEIDILLWWLEMRDLGVVTGSEVPKTENRLTIWPYL